MSKQVNQSYWVVGRHAVELVLSKQLRRVKSICLSEQADLKIPRSFPGKVERVSMQRLTDLVNTDGHQGFALNCEPPSFSVKQLYDLIAQRGSDFVMLVLDKIQDPANFGACLRTAAAMGVDAVVVTRQCSVAITPTVTKVSCGASELLPIVVVSNLVQLVKQCQDKGVWFYATSEHESASLYEQNIHGHAKGIVMGNEQSGISSLLLKTCDYRIVIPTKPLMPSLNVSVATGIVLSEIMNRKK